MAAAPPGPPRGCRSRRSRTPCQPRYARSAGTRCRSPSSRMGRRRRWSRVPAFTPSTYRRTRAQRPRDRPSRSRPAGARGPPLSARPERHARGNHPCPRRRSTRGPLRARSSPHRSPPHTAASPPRGGACRTRPVRPGRAQVSALAEERLPDLRGHCGGTRMSKPLSPEQTVLEIVARAPATSPNVNAQSGSACEIDASQRLKHLRAAGPCSDSIAYLALVSTTARSANRFASVENRRDVLPQVRRRSLSSGSGSPTADRPSRRRERCRRAWSGRSAAPAPSEARRRRCRSATGPPPARRLRQSRSARCRSGRTARRARGRPDAPRGRVAVAAGMSQPSDSTISAPLARCQAFSGVLRS